MRGTEGGRAGGLDERGKSMKGLREKEGLIFIAGPERGGGRGRGGGVGEEGREGGDDWGDMRGRGGGMEGGRGGSDGQGAR